MELQVTGRQDSLCELQNQGKNGHKNSEPFKYIKQFQTKPIMRSKPKLDLIYQKRPIYSDVFSYRRKSWCDTVVSYINRASSYSSLLIDNQRISGNYYRHMVTINLLVELPLESANAIFSKTFKHLQRNGVVAFWSKEPTKSNKLHIHMLVHSDHEQIELRQMIKHAMPDRKSVPWKQQVKPLKEDSLNIYMCYYVCKGKIAGKRKNGKWSKDLYAPKRLLFKKGLGFQKIGVINGFWHRPISQLRKEKQKIESEIAYGIQQPGIIDLVAYLYEFFDKTIPEAKIARSLARNWNSDSVNGLLKCIDIHC